MKIESVLIENFRSFKNETIFFDDYTCLVGPNGGGKSTVLYALNVFFRETENSSTDVVNLSAEDFHKKNTSTPIRITVTFIDLNDEAKEDFKDYFRQDKLIISSEATFNSALNKAEVRQYGQRLGMEEFRVYFEANKTGKTANELKEIYKGLKEIFTTLPTATIKDSMEGALKAYEAEHTGSGVLIPSEDQFYGVSRGVNRLAKYVQWVYIPAVKDVTTEQSENKTTALGKLLGRTVRLKLKFDEVIQKLQEKTETEYGEILGKNQGALEGLEKILAEKLSLWAHPAASVKLAWQKDSKKSVQIEQPAARTIVGEGGFEGDLVRLGHGFQRSYLLALLQVLAGAGEDKEIPRLLLGCEEPELYQHPPQARHLTSVLEQLSSQNSQILVSTHNPVFVTGKGFESVRLVRFDPSAKASKCKQLKFDEVSTRLGTVTGEKPLKPAGRAAKLHQALQPALNEIFFTKNLVLVEGLEDAAVITSWMVLTGRWDEFRQKGIHIVPVNGKSNLAQPLAIAQGFNIPVFTIFDADGDDVGADHPIRHKKDNETLLGLLGGDIATPFPVDTVWGERYVMWPNSITELIKKEIPATNLAACEAKADAMYGHAGGLQKNGLHIGSKLQFAFEDGILPPSLDKLCDIILTTAKE